MVRHWSGLPRWLTWGPGPWTSRVAGEPAGGPSHSGFMEESPVARYWRDVKVNEIGEGTSEVQRMLIARELGC
jgi:alkylation response protein AidB-like acyl-CoA dehydrogenase